MQASRYIASARIFFDLHQLLHLPLDRGEYNQDGKKNCQKHHTNNNHV